MEIKVLKNIMDSNQKISEENRQLFKEFRIFAVNVMASPGAGKTSVLLKIIEHVQNEADIFIVEGDISSDIDARKIESRGVPVLQINTGGGCHLDANMIKFSLNELRPSKGSLFFIENVGNLVCPSAFDLGEHIKLVIASVPEGHDKPYKYTAMFEAADAIILNKTDLLPYVDFDKEAFYKGIRALNSKAPVFELSCKTGEGVTDFITWLKDERIKWLNQHIR